MDDVHNAALQLSFARGYDRALGFNSRRDPKIKLRLTRWRDLNFHHTQFETQRNVILQILDYFTEVSEANGLQETHAVRMLEDASDTIRRGQQRWTARISHRPTAQLQTWNSRNELIRDIPLFNIWDAISFIYTFCVEDIRNQEDAELHLFQFRTIISALRRCDYFATFAAPTTAAATWDSSFSVIAFATTCVGTRAEKARMARARVEFMTAATRIVSNVIQAGLIEMPRNREGNCPEYVLWGIVCRRPGNFYSLCFNVPLRNQGDKSLQFCGWCDAAAEFLAYQSIIVTDLWDTAILVDRRVPANFHNPYPFRRLFSMDDVLGAMRAS
jgi:hypothetical protein